jgi:acetyl esterase
MRFLNLLAAGNPPDARTATVEERRKGLISLMGFAGPPLALEQIDDRTLPGVDGALRIRLYSPSKTAVLPGLIYFHGGGLVAGSMDSHDSIGRALSHYGGVRVLSVDYRLAPEHRFPAAIEDAKAAVDYISAHAADFRRRAPRYLRGFRRSHPGRGNLPVGGANRRSATSTAAAALSDSGLQPHHRVEARIIERLSGRPGHLGP